MERRCTVRSEGIQTNEDAPATSTPVTRKRGRQLTVSPPESGITKQHQKKPKSREEGEWVTWMERKERPARKEGKKERLSQPRSDAVFVTPAAGRNYAEVLKNFKRQVNPGGLGVRVKSFKETRNGDVLIEKSISTEVRGKLSSAIREADGEGRSVRELVSWTKVEVEVHAARLLRTGYLKIGLLKMWSRGTHSCDLYKQTKFLPVCDKRGDPRTDHLPGTMICAAFREPTLRRKHWEAARE